MAEALLASLKLSSFPSSRPLLGARHRTHSLAPVKLRGRVPASRASARSTPPEQPGPPSRPNTAISAASSASAFDVTHRDDPVFSPLVPPRPNATTADTNVAQVHVPLSEDPFRHVEQLQLVRSIRHSTGLGMAASDLAEIPDTDESMSLMSILNQLQASAPVQTLRSRKLILSAADLSPDDLELLAGPSAIVDSVATGGVVETAWPLEMVTLPEFRGEGKGSGEGVTVSLGSTPATVEELDSVLHSTKASALICLQEEASMNLLGLSMEGLVKRAAERHVAVFRIPMGEQKESDQAAVLPEAVRVLASLLHTGHRVHVSCIRGNTCSPLLVLGYLTFFAGEDFSGAMAWIKEHCPGASPSYAAWEQAKDQMSAGINMQRMAELAFEELRERVTSGVPGSSVGDWKAAQRKLLAEVVQQRVADDVAMSELLAEARLLQAEDHGVGYGFGTVPSTKEEAERVMKERERLLTLQVEQLQQSQSEAAGEAAKAARRIEFFRQQVAQLQESKEQAKREAEEAQNKVAALTAQLAEVQAREEQAAMAVKQAEILARVQEQWEGGRAEKDAEEALLEAELEEVKEQNRELEAQLVGAREGVKAAEEWARQLALQLEEVQTLEEIVEEVSVLQFGEHGQPKRDTLAESPATTAAAAVTGASGGEKSQPSAGTALIAGAASGDATSASSTEGEWTAEGWQMGEVLERLSDVLVSEAQVQSMAQQTVQRLALAAEQLKKMQEQEGELVSAWMDTQGKVETLAKELSWKMRDMEEKWALNRALSSAVDSNSVREWAVESEGQEEGMFLSEGEEGERVWERKLLAAWEHTNAKVDEIADRLSQAEESCAQVLVPVAASQAAEADLAEGQGARLAEAQRLALAWAEQQYWISHVQRVVGIGRSLVLWLQAQNFRELGARVGGFAQLALERTRVAFFQLKEHLDSLARERIRPALMEAVSEEQLRRARVSMDVARRRLQTVLIPATLQACGDLALALLAFAGVMLRVLTTGTVTLTLSAKYVGLVLLARALGCMPQPNPSL